MVRESLKKIIKYILLNKYIKSVLWGLAVRLSCAEDAWCLKVNVTRQCEIPCNAYVSSGVVSC